MGVRAPGSPVPVSSLCSRALLLLSRAVGCSLPAPVPALQPADSGPLTSRGLVCAARQAVAEGPAAGTGRDARVQPRIFSAHHNLVVGMPARGGDTQPALALSGCFQSSGLSASVLAF